MEYTLGVICRLCEVIDDTDIAATLDGCSGTAPLKKSTPTACEQENVNTIPPGLIFSKADLFSLLYACTAA